jgi:hypothetical protein
MQRRRPIGTVFEILFPCILFAILYVARSRLDTERNPAVAFASKPVAPFDMQRPYISLGEEASGAPYASPYPASKCGGVFFKLPAAAGALAHPGVLRSLFYGLFDKNYTYIGYAPAGNADVEAVMTLLEGELAYVDLDRKFNYVGFATEDEIQALGSDEEQTYLVGVGVSARAACIY